MQTMGGEQYNSFLAVTKSDTTRVSCRAIYVGGTGDVAVSSDASTTAVVFSAVPVGTTLRIGLDQGRLMSTGTTATLLILLA